MASAKGKRGKSVHDQSLGAFARALEAKCTRYGRGFVKVDRWFPSTQLCSACGALTGPKGAGQLGVRRWRCDCGAEHDRDGNAEINLRAEGRRLLAAGHAER
jgi:putative transposase